MSGALTGIICTGCAGSLGVAGPMTTNETINNVERNVRQAVRVYQEWRLCNNQQQRMKEKEIRMVHRIPCDSGAKRSRGVAVAVLNSASAHIPTPTDTSKTSGSQRGIFASKRETPVSNHTTDTLTLNDQHHLPRK